MKFCFTKKDFIESEVSPDKYAVIGDDFELSWKDFSQKVNKLSSYFIENKFDQLEYPVIIYGHKSANILVAMYAMMNLEIPYIPVDIVYPKERVAKIASISKTELVLNTTSIPLQLQNTNELLLSENAIVINQTASLTKRSTTVIDPIVYMIFTSGSTGEPKGVQITTEAVQSFARWMTSDFGFTANDVFINSAVLSFDLSVFEVMTFGALGASLLLNDKTTTSDPALLLPRIEKYKGSVWVSTPSFALVYSRLKNESKMDSVHSFLFCGEVLPRELAQKLITHYPKAKVLNTYGPTEATVATTLVEITQEIIDAHKSLPVGKSKRESQLIIENEEIIIVGPNVSIGYVQNEELNKKKFTIIDGQRAFKTGDKGYLEDGMLFFNGRDDDLIKLHGYRIELNEINTIINDLDYVLHGECLALKRDGSVKKIVCLAKLQPNVSIEVAKMKADIALRLPAYMIPSDIKFIDEIPLNQNGKVDKKLLTEIYLKG
jgi:D-alanine--poly(phosphoribitol) ligase subunit 1